MHFWASFRTFVFISLTFAFSLAWSEEIRLQEILVQERAEGVAANTSVSILPARELKKKNTQTVAEALRGLTGIDVATSGGLGQPSSVFIRGSKSEHTLVLIDGIEANDPTTTSRLFDFSSLTVENIDRIEVYRGAQGTRFGADAIGGVINIITKKGAGHPTGSVGLAAGTYDVKKVNGSVAGSDGYFSYSASASYLTALGFSAAKAGDRDEPDGINRSAVSSRLDWDFTDETSSTITVRVIDAATKLDSGGGVTGDDPNYDSSSRQILTGAHLRSKFLDRRLESSLGGFFSTSKRQYDNAPDSNSPTDYHETFQSEGSKVETRHTYSFSEDSRVEVTAQYRQEEASPSRRQSVFGESLLYSFKALGLTAELGVRHDKASTSDESILSSSASVGYDFETSGTKLRFNYGTGFKNPSLFQLYSVFGSTSLQSEKALTWDLGIEQRLHERAVASVTYFSTRFTNLIDFNTTTSKYANIAKAKSDGIELQMAWTPTEKTVLRMTAKNMKTEDETSGLPLLRRPSWSGEISAERNESEWSAEVRYRFIGEREDLNPQTYTRMSLPSYSIVGLGGRYRLGSNCELGLQAENVFDLDYEDIAGYRTARTSYLISFNASF